MDWEPPGNEMYECYAEILATPSGDVPGQRISFSLLPLCAVWEDEEFSKYTIYQGVPKSAVWEVTETTESGEVTENYSTLSFSRAFTKEIDVTATVDAVFNIPGDEVSPLEVEISGEESFFPINQPKIIFSLDEAPLTVSSKIYLGQKVRLSFTSEKKIRTYAWEIDPPFVSEFRIDREDQETSEIIRGKEGKNKPVEFIVYSLDRHKKKMTFRLKYEYGGFVFTEEGEFSFLGPDIDAYGYKQLVPEIYPFTGKGGTTTRLGYHPNIEKADPIGHFGLMTAKNPTDIKYAFFYAQLVSLDVSRGFEGVTNEEFVEIKNWLDQGFPYLDSDHPDYLELAPGETISLKKSFEDSPSFPFQEDRALPDPLWYKSKSNFSVFIFARPNLPNCSYVPLLHYTWYWRADAERKGSSWDPVKGSFFPPFVVHLENEEEIPLCDVDENCELGFPKWSKKIKGVLPWKQK
jgi:hypothetical protein